LPPLALFRTSVRNPAMVDAMATWGAHTLGPSLSVDPADREVVIQRTCVRLGCEYEWGVHATLFAPSAGISPKESAVLAGAGPVEQLSGRAQVLVRLVDELQDTASVSDALWAELELLWSGDQLIDLLLLTGWYPPS